MQTQMGRAMKKQQKKIKNTHKLEALLLRMLGNR